MSLISEAMVKAAMGPLLPAADTRYIWHVEWLYEDDRAPSPHALDHPSPKGALDHMIMIWNANRVLIHLSVSRRNA